MEKTGSKPINELVQAAIQGNGTAFTALWDMYIDQLRVYIRSMMRKQDDLYIDDICSRSFEKAFRQISAFDPSKSQFITWLRVIAHNTALDLKEREDRLYPKNQVVYLDDTTKPTSVLDTISQAQVILLLRKLQEERDLGYLFITHDRELARHFCTEIYELRQGAIEKIRENAQKSCV